MELRYFAFVLGICFFQPVQGQECKCSGGCNTNHRIFPGSNGRIVDVAFGKGANMSSTYSSAEGTSGPACVAVNGKIRTVFRTLETGTPNCVHTAVGDYPNAWWEVDLGRNYTVTNVTIYRRENYQRRMSGIHVEVDNQPCYSFPLMANNATALLALPDKIEVTCVPPLTGRVVRLQKRGQGYNYQYGAHIINVCEVQVWGCADAYVEPDCKCGHCRGGVRCDNTTLGCPSGRCDKGWTSSFCNESCPAGTFGDDCGDQCGQCAGSDTCNTVTGLCPHGCQPGWQGDNCKQECRDGFYGVNCTSRCGNCSDGEPCNKVNGTCPSGCQPGFQPSDTLCKTACTGSTYGSECAYQCGQCENNAPCDVVSGHCQACQPNLLSPLCQVCEGKLYGAQCDRQCSAQCGGGGSCHRNNGSCLAGCVSGYLLGRSGLCDETCENGTYGFECAKTCDKCEASSCNHANGTCTRGCVAGFSGDMCQEPITAESDTTPADITSIVGAVVGVVVLIVIILIIVIIVVRRRRRQPKETTATSGTEVRSQGADNNAYETTLSFAPIRNSESKESKPDKPSAAVKPTVLKKQQAKKHEAANASGHIYYNTAALESQPTHPARVSSPPRPSGGLPPRAQRPASTRQPADPADFDEETVDGNAYYNDEEDVYASFKASQPKLDAVQKYLVDSLASGRLKGEFATLEPMPEGVPQEVAQLKKNFKKNRFAAILPYDHNRVVLKDGYSEGTATDFVNASYISGYRLDKQFIAAQGPRDNTVGDLWRTIWQEKITHVVMLTNIQERGKPKCELYWPEEEGGVNTYGPVTVTTTHVQCRDDFYIRTFHVTREDSDETREVTQYHYVSWPDHGVPTTTSLVTFWRYVHNRTKPSSGASAPPVLVHCSAGVGRTGTYIGLEVGVDMAVQEGRLSVRDLVSLLREQRCLMVQAVDQYVFLHKALLEAYTAHGTNVSVDQFDAVFPEHITSGKPHPRVDKEFQTLQQMLTVTPPTRQDTASLEENMPKNRNPDILPSEEHLVYLTEHVSGRNQYINAVFMPTFRDHRGSIVTQLPLPSTLVDFWRLVYGNDVSAIVSLSSPNEEQEEKPYCLYWPTKEGDSVKSGPYYVALNKKTERRGTKVTSYTLSLGKKGVKTPRLVELLHYQGWTSKVGGSASDILHLIDTLVTLQANTDTSRLVVQCSDGVGKSGLFCALCDIINRMTYDREVDVYMTVRHVQSVTPKALSSATQYRYCYEVAQSRVREMSVYANAPQR